MGPVAIVDYGLGNLFSVRQACEHSGMQAEVTADPARIADAAALILPGVGAFGDAMDALRDIALVDPIRSFAASGKPLLGVCLGFQLLMERSEEFGDQEGLGIFSGSVRRLRGRVAPECKVPNIGWSAVHPAAEAWAGTLLDGVADGEFFYFVHSFYVAPTDASESLAESEAGGFRYCCAMQHGNVFGCQFHPERSGERGLRVYENLRKAIEAAPA